MRPDIAQMYRQLLSVEEVPKGLETAHELAQEYSSRLSAGLLTPMSCCVLASVWKTTMQPKEATEEAVKVKRRGRPPGHKKTEANKYECINCGKQFIDQKTLDQHFRMEHKGMGGK